MKVSQKHEYHGIAVALLMEHSFVGIAPHPKGQFGHIRINGDRDLLMKYCTKKDKNNCYSFTFTSENIQCLRDNVTSGSKSYVALICAKESICALSFEEFREVIDIDKAATQRIAVECRPNGSMWVKGSKGSLSRAVYHKSFPSKIFK